MQLQIQKTRISILLLVFMLLMSTNTLDHFNLPGNQMLVLRSGITKSRSVMEQRKGAPATVIAKTVTDNNKTNEPLQLKK